MTAIRPLPANVAARVRSSVLIVSLNDAVVGLLHNALDAGASTITLEVDYARGSCSVEDDGFGIPSIELSNAGALAKEYCTSKYGVSVDEQLHGFRGVFLASLSTLCILSVVSKHQHESTPGKLRIYRGERIKQESNQVRASDQLKSRRHGTKVTAYDLFGNMPVRVKSRPIGLDGKRTREQMFRKLTNTIAGVVLAWCSDLNITVHDADRINLWRVKSLTRHDDRPSLRERSNFNERVLCNFLTQITEGRDDWSTWVKTAARGLGLRVRGLFSKTSASSRNYQFVSIGIHYLPRDDIFGSLYDEINRIISSSEYGHNTISSNPRRFHKKATDSGDLQTAALVNSAATRAEFDQHPMFYVRIDIDKAGVLHTRPDDLKPKDIANVNDIIGAMVSGFLENQRIRPRQRRKRRTSQTSSDASSIEGNHRQVAPAARTLPSSSRMKLGLPMRTLRNPIAHTLGSGQADSNATHHGEDSNNDNSNDVWTSKFSFSTKDEDAAVRLCRDVESGQTITSDQGLAWQDGKSGQTYFVNARTGMVESESLHIPVDYASHAQHAMASPNRLTLPRVVPIAETEDESLAAWANETLKSWQNQVFPLAEAPIPSASLQDKDIEHLFTHDTQSINTRGNGSELWSERVFTFESKISHYQLREAKVIAQVDRKFILAQVSASSTEMNKANQASLILVDQHAADERARVEELMAELCQPNECEATTMKSLDLGEPLVFDITLQDGKLFIDDEAFWASWGIRYSFGAPLQPLGDPRRISKPSASAKMKIVVHGVSPVIAERCRLDPPLLRSLLLKEVHKRDELGLIGSKRMMHPDDVGNWLRQIHDCPQGILDLVNSRACRSSIMFNDELTLQECRDVVSRLAATVFPFQCAHGRPSLVPISSVMPKSISSVESERAAEFGKAWRLWEHDRRHEDL